MAMECGEEMISDALQQTLDLGETSEAPCCQGRERSSQRQIDHI